MGKSNVRCFFFRIRLSFGARHSRIEMELNESGMCARASQCRTSPSPHSVSQEIPSSSCPRNIESGRIVLPCTSTLRHSVFLQSMVKYAVSSSSSIDII